MTIKSVSLVLLCLRIYKSLFPIIQTEVMTKDVDITCAHQVRTGTWMKIGHKLIQQR